MLSYSIGGPTHTKEVTCVHEPAAKSGSEKLLTAITGMFKGEGKVSLYLV